MPRYLLKIDGKTSGPHSVAALQETASVRAFDEKTPITEEFSEDWKAISDVPSLHALLFPARKAHSLKAKAFESLPEETKEPVSVQEILHANLVAEAKIARPGLTRRSYRDRRARDFVVSVVLCDFAAAALWWYLPRNHDTTLVLLSFLAIIDFGLYWLFYQIMDRY